MPVAAGLCGDKKVSLPVAGINGAKGVPYASCAELGAAQKFIAAILKVPEPLLPTCETTRTTLSALRLSGIPLLLRSQTGGGSPTDDKLDSETLLLATLPGEPVTRLAIEERGGRAFAAVGVGGVGCVDGGDCIGPGCMDTLATNYNPVATVDDGSCFYGPCPPGLLADCSGITCYDSLELMSFVGDWHCNNGLWTAGSWEVGDMVLDCAAYNYDGGDCVVTGCTDPAAWNYYEHATTDDGTCQYGTCPPGTEDCMGHCIPQNWIGVNDCPGGLSADPLAHLHNGAYPDSLLFNIPVGSTPRGMCVLPDGSKAFIGSGAAGGARLGS